jgi:FkbM family methyltransferase
MESQPNSSGTDPAKSVSNMLREPPLESMVNSGTESVKTSDGLEAPAERDGGENERQSASQRTRDALWRFTVSWTEPVLSRLRDYFTVFVADLNRSNAALIDLARSANRRAAATWHSVGALKEQIETLARREDVENLARQMAALKQESVDAHQLMEVLLNRNLLLFGDALIARTSSGFLLAPNDDLPLVFNLAEGVLSKDASIRVLDFALKEGMTFVDVGAHVGAHTLHAARRVGASGTVIAFEPTPKVFEFLKRSIHLNGLDKVCRCLDIAVASSEGVATFHMSRHSGNNSLCGLVAAKEEEAIEVRTASLDQLLQGMKRVDVVKIDVQGAELDVLDGMKQVLADHRDILLIVDYAAAQLHPLGIKPSEWFARFFAHGFDLFANDERTNRWLQIPEDRVSQLSSTSVVFVRPETSLWTIVKQDER